MKIFFEEKEQNKFLNILERKYEKHAT